MKIPCKYDSPGLLARHAGNEDGVVLLEFAVAAALYFMLIFTLFDFAIQFQKHLTIADTMRQASREAVVKEQAGNCTDISNRAVQELEDRLTRFGYQPDQRGATVRNHHSQDPNSGTTEDTLGVDLHVEMDSSSIINSIMGASLRWDANAYVPVEDIGDTSDCP